MADRALISAIEERLSEATVRGLGQAVTAAIRDRMIVPGTRLPPIREVARELALSPTTVSSCWRLLARSGVVRSDGRRGTVVLDRAAPQPTRYRAALDWQTDMRLDLSTGTPDRRLLPSLSGVPLPSTPVPLGYLAPSVVPELRDLVLADWPCAATDIVVVDGAMDALDLLVQTQLGYGDRVAIDHPGFTPLIDLLESVGAEIVTLDMDEEGIRPDELAAALATPLAAVILQPRAQNPTGITMSRSRARTLGHLLAPTSVLVIEDDSAGAVAGSAPISLGPWLPDRLVHIRSYSKSHGPDLRLAVMTGPEEVLAQVEARRHLGQGWTSRLLQRLLAVLLTDPDAIATVDLARRTYAARRTALVEGLARRGVSVGPGDGLNVWVPVEDESVALVRLAREDIGVAPGSAFILRPGYPQHIRVTAGLLPAERADEVAAALAAAAVPGPGRRRLGR